MNITIVSSSTREGRISHRIALGLEKNINERGHEATIIDLNEHKLPMFEKTYGQYENPSSAMKHIADVCEASDAFIFLTPEYNGSVVPALKNFIDIYAKDPFAGKAIGVATGSTGMMGGIRCAHQLQLIILGCFAYPIPQMLLVGQMQNKFDEKGNLTDESFGSKMEAYLDDFIGFAEKL